MTKYIAIGITGALIAILSQTFFPGFFGSLEQETYDKKLIFRGSVPTHSDLIVIDADSSSKNLLGLKKWNRAVYAEIIDALKEKGVQEIIFDIVFDLPTENKEQDRRLVASTQAASNVVFPAEARLPAPGETESRPNLSDSRTPQSQPAFPEKFIAEFPLENPNSKNFKSIVTSPESININYSFDELVQVSHGMGHVAKNSDPDGVVRRVPLYIRHQGRLVPSLGLVGAIKYLEPSHVEFQESALLLKEVRLPGNDDSRNIRIPMDSQGQMLINYAGPWGTFTHIPVAALLGKTSDLNKEHFKGKLALILRNDVGGDLQSIPLQTSYPGGGIHANIINTILTQNFLHAPPKSVHIGIILFLSLVASTLFSFRKYSFQLFGIGLLAATYIIVNVWLFFNGVVIELFVPVLSILVSGLLASSYNGYRENKTLILLTVEKKKLNQQLAGIEKQLAGKTAELEQIQKLLLVSDSNQKAVSKEGGHRTHERDNLKDTYTKIEEEKKTLEKIKDKINSQIQSIPDKKLSDQLIRECRQAGIITRSPEVLSAFQLLKKYAPSSTPILILGESGTGKELFARAVHDFSPRQNKPFIPVNIGAIPNELIESELFGHAKGSFTGASTATKGILENADKGTVFLDEIGDASQKIQVKMLRTLEENEIQRVGASQPIKIDTRIVSATNKNLKDEISKGHFREDLYYRLNVLEIKLPPLRDRKKDIEILANHFLDIFQNQNGFQEIKGFSKETIKKLEKHDWPGNIRELRNVINRAVLKTGEGEIGENDIQLDDAGTLPVVTEKTEMNDDLFLETLRQTRFEINEAKDRLGITRNTVTLKLKGICFYYLVKNNFDSEKTVQEVAGDVNLEDPVRRKITEYQDNLAKTVKKCNPDANAIDAILKSSRIPIQYKPSLEVFIRHLFSEQEPK